MTHTRFLNGFSQEFSDVVAKAAATLPALTHMEDSEFMRHMLMMTVEAFWNNFITQLPQEDQDAFLKIEAGDDKAKMAEWFGAHLDFSTHEEFHTLAEKVMDEIDAKLPAIMAKEYADQSSTPQII